MSKVIVLTSVSVDGFMEGPDGDLSWHQVDEEVHEHFNAVLGGIGAFLNGRRNYEMMEAYWPAADQSPDVTPVEAAFARIWRDTPKVVYSKTLATVGPDARLYREVVPDEVAALQREVHGDVVVGGATLAASFLRHNLVDEYRVYVHPVTIGRGRGPFPADMRVDLQLLDTHTFGNGVVLLHYRCG